MHYFILPVFHRKYVLELFMTEPDARLYANDEYFAQDPDFPLSIVVRTPQPPSCFHRHEFSECVFVINGRGLHRSNENAPEEISKGDILIIPPQGNHAFVESCGMSVINLLFDASKLPPLLMELYAQPMYRELFIRDISHYENRDYPKLTPPENVFNEMKEYLFRISEADSLSNAHSYKLGLFMALISRLCSLPSSGNTETVEPPLNITKLSAYMQRNFNKAIYLDDLARISGMSRSSLIRHFRSAFGTTPMMYLQKLRLIRSAELLKNTDFTLKEIAEMTGFQSDSYFFRIFHRAYGMTPQTFRLRKKAE